MLKSSLPFIPPNYDQKYEQNQKNQMREQKEKILHRNDQLLPK